MNMECFDAIDAPRIRLSVEPVSFRLEAALTREELFSDLLASPPGGDEMVYIERRGENYALRRGGFEAGLPTAAEEAGPDVWIYYSGRWPSPDEPDERWRAFVDDLLDEMESMAGGMDRCRWPLDEPWPHGH